MRSLRSVTLASLALVVGFSLWASPLAGRQQTQPPSAVAVPNEVLIQFRNDASSAQREEALATVGGVVSQQFDGVAVQVSQLDASVPLETAIALLQAHPDVLAVQPNYIRRIDAPAPPNDPYWLSDSLWGLLRIQAPAVWTAFTRGSTSAVIADIDTGVNYNHPDLAANMWRNPGEIAGNGVDDDGNGYVDDIYGIDTLSHDSDPADDNGHGTHVAGTIGGVGNNGVGVVGVNWNTRVLACKFLSGSGSGTDAGAVECFNYIVALKNRGVNIRVSSNSWGSLRDSGPFPQVLKNAIDAAGAAGILNVFAAGNDNANTEVRPFDPASFTSPSILSVAASDGSDVRASFSNYGATSIDLAAPGVSILSTYGTGYAWLNGTSMATPHVAGAAALVLAQRPALSGTEVKGLLINNVDVLPQWSSLVASGGRLNVYKAVLASSPNVAPSVSLTNPGDGATFVAPATVPLEATAVDSDGAIARVDFVVNGTVVSSDTTQPYAATLTNVGVGSYTVAAVATDTLGAATTSAARTFTVTSSGGGGSAVAAFVRTDTSTQGTWKGSYGADGYVVVNDSASVPSYAQVTPGGQSAWTWAAPTTDVRGLQQGTGSSRLAATWYGSVFTVDVTISGSQARQVALYSLDYENAGRQQRYDLFDRATGVLLDSRTIGGFSGGQYVVWNVLGAVRVHVTRLAGNNAVVGGVFFGPAAASSGSGSAVFVRSDPSTQGTWKGTYGGDGFVVVNDSASLPAYGQVTPGGQSAWTWASPTSDVRGLQQGTGGNRLAATWYASAFTIDLTVTGSQARQVALYSLDYENAGRQQRFDLLDGATGAVLDSRTIANFSGGQYLVWNVLGSVRVQVTRLAGPNAVVGGVFFGPVAAAGGSGSAAFVGTDTTTQGTWKGAYGADGYLVVADSASLPSFGQVTPSGQSVWTWAAPTTDVRALQQGSGPSRLAATWYGSTFSIALTVSGTQPRQVAFYSLDYENGGRQQRYDLLDGATGAVLDSRTITNFSGGQYVVWNVLGSVRVQVTSLAGPNAVVSGVFFR